MRDKMNPVEKRFLFSILGVNFLSEHSFIVSKTCKKASRNIKTITLQ